MAGRIVVVGLGPGDPAMVPSPVINALEQVGKIILRTDRHPAVAFLEKRGFKWETFDCLYEKAGNSEELYREMVERLIQMASLEDVVYAVPGHPMVAEDSVTLLIEEGTAAGIEVNIIPAMSCLDALFTTLKLNPAKGLVIADALDFQGQNLDPGTGLLIIQVYNRQVAADIKLSLMELYLDEYEVTVIRGAGIPGHERMETVPLYTVDRIPWIDHLTSIYVPPFPEGRDRTLPGLAAIMATLRGKGGCPWDREQTNYTLKRYLIEETYEVLEAIDAGNMNKLCEELGDLLLQVVFHARIAEEDGYFNINDCLETISSKMRRRHPHVFGSVVLKTAGEVVERWDKIKAVEKKENGAGHNSVLSVPRGLPALLMALKVQEQAARVGFDWNHLEGVWDKVYEEMAELKKASEHELQDAKIDETGDLLFAIVNLSRWMNINPETALYEAVNRFMDRFRYMEETIRKNGGDMEETSMDKLNILWEKAKKFQENIRKCRRLLDYSE